VVYINYFIYRLRYSLESILVCLFYMTICFYSTITIICFKIPHCQWRPPVSVTSKLSWSKLIESAYSYLPRFTGFICGKRLNKTFMCYIWCLNDCIEWSNRGVVRKITFRVVILYYTFNKTIYLLDISNGSYTNLKYDHDGFCNPIILYYL